MVNTSYFGGASLVDSWTSDYAYSLGIPIAVGRAMASGAGPILITALGVYAAGRGANRSCVISLGTATSGAFTLPAGGNGNQYVAQVVSGGYATGGTAQITIDCDGAFYFGRGGSGDTYDAGGYVGAGALGGAYNYAQAPTAPRTLSVTPGVGAANLSWVIPLDDGDTPITGYMVIRATNAGFSTGVVGFDISPATSYTVTGLTPGTTYWFQVRAKNAVTTLGSSTSQPSNIVSTLVGSGPGAPTGVTATGGAGLIGVGWVAPASDGGSAITSYEVDRATNSGFTVGLVTTSYPSTARTATQTGLAPGTTYYYRVRAVNSIGAGANSSSANAATFTRDVLDLVQGAAIHLADGKQVELRSDGAATPTITLGYTLFGSGSSFVAIATLPTGAGANQFGVSGGPRGLALVADPAGNLYVIGPQGSNGSALLIKRYARSAPTAWAASGELAQSLASTGDAIVAVAASYVDDPGVKSIFVLARRAGTVGAGALSYATLALANIAASAGAAFIASGSDPAWLSAPPSGAPINSGVVDVAPLVAGGSRLAILANGFAVVDVDDGIVTGVSKSTAGTAVAGPWARVIGVNSTTFATLTAVAGALSWTFYGATGALLGSGSYAGANALGGAFLSQWAAFYDRVTSLVTVHYVADDSARKLEAIDISPITYAATAAVVLTSALGAASSTNGTLRDPVGPVDERRILVAAANLLTGTKSTAVYADLSGNIAPSAPSLVDEVGYDATTARVFSWAFADPNPADTQTAYEFVIERVSDGVAIVSTGKVSSATSSRSVAGATLTNGVNCRWRVRTYDVLDVVSAWSSYDTFSTAATGTLTITNPASNNPPGLEVSSLLIEWTYAQANGYVQTQRRVRVVRISDSVVLSDSTMQATTTQNYTVTALPTDEPVRIEVSIVTNAPGTPTIGPVNRTLTTSYGMPMTPAILLAVGESYIEISVTNPAPSGSRPEVVQNDVERRLAGIGSFIRIAIIGHDGIYRDHAVKSGASYEYRVKGVS